jgi:ABC-2 type transport system ATP-binding protein
MADDFAIEVKNVSKDFLLPHEKITSIKGLFLSTFKRRRRVIEKQHALRDVSFNIKKGEFFGIVGRNGSGKSTMLKMLAGIYQPTSGTIHVEGRLVPFIELGVGFNPELTGRENVYLNGAIMGFSQKETAAMYDDIVAFAELEKFMDQKLKNYSSGMLVRLAFSVAIKAEADILLVDEVLAVGDADFQRKCFDYFHSLKRNKKTVVFVTHEMAAVREYCDRAILIDNSKLVLEADPNTIATGYSRLFMEEKTIDGEAGRKMKRWGDKTITYSSVRIKKTITDDKKIDIYTEAVAHTAVPSPIFGFMIRNASGQPLMGTNSKIKRQTLGELRAGEAVQVHWTIPNVFSDGKYFVDPAIVHEDGVRVADWWENAAAFTVLKEDRTPYIITPNVALTMVRK